MRRKPGTLLPLEVEICECAAALRSEGLIEVHGYELAKRLADAAERKSLTAYGTLYRSHEDHQGARIEAADVLRIRRDDPVAARAGAEHHGRIDHIGRPLGAAQLAGFAGPVIVKARDLDVRCRQQASQPCLASSISPHLADHAGRHHQRVAVLQRSCQQPDDVPVIPIEGNEGAGIECQAGHLVSH